MANNYVEFSEQIKDLTKAELDWWEEHLSFSYCEACDFHTSDKDLDECPKCEAYIIHAPYSFETNSQEKYIWFFAEEWGDTDWLAEDIQKFLKLHRPDDCFELNWSYTCSKLRLGEFSGGAAFITANSIEYCMPYSFLVAKRQEFRRNKKQDADSIQEKTNV